MTMSQTFNSPRPLSIDELRHYAPSVFATEAHHSRSDRFRAIPTIEMVKGLASEGWSVVKAGQSVTRIADKAPFTKHMLRFRQLHQTLHAVGDNLLELVLVNGNDGSSAYNLHAGVFRIACLNGMIVKSKDFGSVKVRHTGDAVQKVIEGSYEVLRHADVALRAPQDWSQIQLLEHERHAFAVGAHVERFGLESNTLVEPQQLLEARRVEDKGNDLWSVFNRIQENATKGGLQGSFRAMRERMRETGQRARRTTTRDVNGIDQNVNLNSGLWAMAEWLSENAAAAKR